MCGFHYIRYLLCKAVVACVSVSLCAVLGFLLMPREPPSCVEQQEISGRTHPFIPSIDIFLKFIIC